MIYTIGHSNINQESFIEILKLFNIQIVVDVRSTPYNNYVSHFNRENISKSLNENNIRYIFLGNYIGGKPKDEEYYKDSKVDYDLIAKTEHYKEGIAKIITLNRDNIVLMCSEEDPKSCHRHHLITQSLIKKGFEVDHIRKNGKINKIIKPDKKDVQKTLF